MDKTLYARITREFGEDVNDAAVDTVTDAVNNVLDSIGDDLSSADAAITMFEAFLEVLGIEPAAVYQDVVRVFSERVDEAGADIDEED